MKAIIRNICIIVFYLESNIFEININLFTNNQAVYVNRICKYSKKSRNVVLEVKFFKHYSNNVKCIIHNI